MMSVFMVMSMLMMMFMAATSTVLAMLMMVFMLIMIVVMLVGVLGMFGDAKAEVAYYLVPLYNSVQCMIGIFSFDFQPLNVAVCVIANLAYAGVGVLALQRMFDSERLMFAR